MSDTIKHGDPFIRLWSLEEAIEEMEREAEDADATDMENSANLYRAVIEFLREKATAA